MRSEKVDRLQLGAFEVSCYRGEGVTVKWVLRWIESMLEMT